MGGDVDPGTRARRGRRAYAAGVVVACASLIASGAWLYGQVPQVKALEAGREGLVLSSSILDGQAGLVARRLSEAAGRTLESVASELPGPSANEAAPDAPVVAGAQAASAEYAETLARLSEAEQAAAEQLAQSEEEAAQAQADRRRAAEELAEEEAAAAREIDAAIAAAIAAAEAETAYTGPLTTDPATGWGNGGGRIPSGSATSTEEVLALVRKYFPPDEVGNAMAIARCESGHTNAVGEANSNGTRDFGVFQINDGGTLQAALRRIGVSYLSITDAREKALDPQLNVRMARAIWDSRGWQPWVCAAKTRIVAGLYQRAPGPMYGQYDEHGLAL